jgi:D-alanyl-D-alanine carboxypeptidase
MRWGGQRFVRGRKLPARRVANSGVKTGSTAAAGGCLAFRAIRWIDGKRTTITGVVLGQPGQNQIAAGLAAADAMVDGVAGHSRRRWVAPSEARSPWVTSVLCVDAHRPPELDLKAP